MIAIRGNFFYTRTVPCELWFLNKAKPKQLQDKVLMLDARSVYRKVTRKIFDFSPEQLANLTSIVWLYRGQSERFLALVEQHLDNAVIEADLALKPTEDFADALEDACDEIVPFFKGKEFDAFVEFDKAVAVSREDASTFAKAVDQTKKIWAASKRDNQALKASAGKIGELAERSHDLVRQIDHVSKLFARLVDTAESELNARDDEKWSGREIRTTGKQLEERRAAAPAQLNLIRYFARHAHWLQERFPDAKLRDVEGLVKLVSFKELEANDWSLTPGRYVGVAPQEEDEDFDFEETMHEIHSEITDLNAEAIELAATIAKNFERLVILKTAVGVGWSADCLARPAVVGQLGARRGGERN
jgi:type I restriction enzyme M protein